MGAATLVQLWQLAKQYGPVVGLLLALIFWLSWRLDKVMDRNAQVYEAHIKQLSEIQNWLLTKIIGPQPSSTGQPTIQQMKETVKRAEEKEGGKD